MRCTRNKRSRWCLLHSSLVLQARGSDKIDEFITGCRQMSWATWSIEIVFSFCLACGCKWQESRWSLLRAMLQQRRNSSTPSQAQAIDQMTDSLPLCNTSFLPDHFAFHRRNQQLPLSFIVLLIITLSWFFSWKNKTFIYFIWTSRKKRKLIMF